MPVNLFDANFYRAANPDLASLDDAQALSHFQTYGLNEGRAFSPFVDLNFYRASYSDLAGFTNSQALEHLKIYGLNEGRQFSQTFDINYYRSVNFDLAAAGLNNQQLYEHFQLYGIGEGRASSPFFNVSYYLANNSDLRALSFNNFQAYEHFVLFGSQEKRFARSSSFDIKFDYRFDTDGFFDGPNRYRRDSLEAAATIWEAIITDEFPDVPVGTTTPSVKNPQTGVFNNFTTDALIDDLVVFVGARELGDSTGAEGFISGYYTNEPRYTSSNFEPWAGSIAFDTSTQDFFDTTPNTSSSVPIENVDFISVAVHELGHVLGIGTSPAFKSFVSDGFFNGPNAKALNGNNPIPLDLELKHVRDNIFIGGVESQALMEDSFTRGIQKLPTALDIALLADIGYQLPNI